MSSPQIEVDSTLWHLPYPESFLPPRAAQIGAVLGEHAGLSEEAIGKVSLGFTAGEADDLPVTLRAHEAVMSLRGIRNALIDNPNGLPDIWKDRYPDNHLLGATHACLAAIIGAEKAFYDDAQRPFSKPVTIAKILSAGAATGAVAFALTDGDPFASTMGFAVGNNLGLFGLKTAHAVRMSKAAYKTMVSFRKDEAVADALAGSLQFDFRG